MPADPRDAAAVEAEAVAERSGRSGELVCRNRDADKRTRRPQQASYRTDSLAPLALPDEDRILMPLE